MDEKESNVKYLYGASVQGIQDFIFQTNKLKEIAGGSELVEKICTEDFKDYAEGESIVRAAGNIKHIFYSKDKCEKAVLEFPKKVMTNAPGITISQAVVRYSAENGFEAAVNELEKKLLTQRNKPVRSMTLGLMAIERSRASGLPGISYKENEVIDESSDKKREIINKDISEKIFRLPKKSFGDDVKISEKNMPLNIEKLTGSDNWIAIIHADGNGLGKIIEKIGNNKDALRSVSKKLDEATTAAANTTYKILRDKLLFDEKIMIPIRPIVLSGDDITLICRADLALPYIKHFLKEFEKETKERFKEINNYDILKEGLTACAGIAFIKSNYPFHYAVHLAENLCKEAKKEAKTLNKEKAPSCLMFHKVQDSFIEDFDKIAERELKTNGLNFKFGPYYLNPQDGKWTIQDILDKTDLLKSKDGNAIKSHLREWISLLFENPSAADQKMKRLLLYNEKINNEKKKEIIENLNLEKYKIITEVKDNIPFYDMLSLLSLQKQEVNYGK